MPSTRVLVADSGKRGPQGPPGDRGPAGNGGVPLGGTTGQVLKKNSGTDYDVVWGAAAGTGVPAGGTVDQSLFKNSSTDGDASWKDPGVVIHGKTAKTTPVDADEFGIVDSAASFGWKRISWANVKAAMKTYLDGTGIAKLATGRSIDGVTFDGTANITVVAPATHAATSKTTPSGSDELPIADSAASFALKRLTFTNLQAWIVAFLTDDFDNKQDVSTMLDAVLDVLPNVTITADFNSGTSSWPTLDTALSTDSRVSWLFRFGDESTPPPTVSGKSTWVRAA